MQHYPVSGCSVPISRTLSLYLRPSHTLCQGQRGLVEASLESEGGLVQLSDPGPRAHPLDGERELGGDLLVLGALHREQVQPIAVHSQPGDQGHHVERHRHGFPFPQPMLEVPGLKH